MKGLFLDIIENSPISKVLLFTILLKMNFSIYIILPIPLENPSCHSLYPNTDFADVIAMKSLPIRQWQIVMLMIQSKRPKDIARILSIQRTTVYRHQVTVRKLYGVHGSIKLMGVIVSELATSISEFTLTSRGKESFELALDGKMISEISKLLCISFSGVLRHREKILEENACHSMNKLIAKYYGLFSDSSSLTTSYREK